jgi:hypothetical protein
MSWGLSTPAAGVRHSVESPHMKTETKRQRAQRLRRTREQRRRLRKQLSTDDDVVLTFKEWCALNRIGERNGRRLLREGLGPKLTHLSERRIGIRRRDNRAWLDARAR